VVKLLKKCRVR